MKGYRVTGALNDCIRTVCIHPRDTSLCPVVGTRQRECELGERDWFVLYILKSNKRLCPSSYMINYYRRNDITKLTKLTTGFHLAHSGDSNIPNGNICYQDTVDKINVLIIWKAKLFEYDWLITRAIFLIQGKLLASHYQMHQREISSFCINIKPLKIPKRSFDHYD